MSYFELVELIEELKDKPRNDNDFNTINQNSLNFSGNILLRFIDKITIFIINRLDKACHKLVESFSNFRPTEEINLELIEFNKEIEYLKKYANLNVFPNEVKNNITNIIDIKRKDLFDHLLEFSNAISNDELTNIINSYK